MEGISWLSLQALEVLQSEYKLHGDVLDQLLQTTRTGLLQLLFESNPNPRPRPQLVLVLLSWAPSCSPGRLEWH
jgi:hypothetical protein